MKSCKDKIHKKTRSTKKRLVSLEHESGNGLKVRRSEVKGLGWDHTCLSRCLHVSVYSYHISKKKKNERKKSRRKRLFRRSVNVPYSWGVCTVGYKSGVFLMTEEPKTIKLSV